MEFNLISEPNDRSLVTQSPYISHSIPSLHSNIRISLFEECSEGTVERAIYYIIIRLNVSNSKGWQPNLYIRSVSSDKPETLCLYIQHCRFNKENVKMKTDHVDIDSDMTYYGGCLEKTYFILINN